MPKLDIKITPQFNNWQRTINSAIYPMTYCVWMKKLMSLIYQFCKYITENAKTMLITNFPIYWSCDELADLFVTMYCHRTFGFHVHCCCELTILYSVSLVEFPLYSLIMSCMSWRRLLYSIIAEILAVKYFKLIPYLHIPFHSAFR